MTCGGAAARASWVWWGPCGCFCSEVRGAGLRQLPRSQALLQVEEKAHVRVVTSGESCDPPHPSWLWTCTFAEVWTWMWAAQHRERQKHRKRQLFPFASTAAPARISLSQLKGTACDTSHPPASPAAWAVWE